jgi:hypothetical protein
MFIGFVLYQDDARMKSRTPQGQQFAGKFWPLKVKQGQVSDTTR